MIQNVKRLFKKIKDRKNTLKFGKLTALDISLFNFANNENSQKVKERDRQDTIIKSFNDIVCRRGFMTMPDPFSVDSTYAKIDNQINAYKYNGDLYFELSTFKSTKKADNYYNYLRETYNNLDNEVKRIEEKKQLILYLKNSNNMAFDDIELILLEKNYVLYCNFDAQYENEAMSIIKEIIK